MSNQRTWALLVLLLGITAFPKIAAEFDAVAEDPDISDMLSTISTEDCPSRFEYMMSIAMSSLNSKDPTGASEIMSKIIKDFLSCTMKNGFGLEAIAMDHDFYEHQQFPVPKDWDGKLMRELSLAPVIDEAVQQINEFHQRPDYDRAAKRLQQSLHKRIREFVDSGLHKEDYQTNYVILIKQMLYDMSEVVLRRNLVTKVQIVVDRRLNPYINKKAFLPVLRSGKQSDGFSSMEVSELATTLENLAVLSEPYFLPDCLFEKMESTIECVLTYVAALVMLESMVDENHTALKFWDPFGVKLLANIEILLLKILKSHHDDRALALRFGVPAKSYLDDVYKARASIIFCLDRMREKQDNMSMDSSTYNKLAVEMAINKCVKSTTEQATDLMYYIMLNAGVGEVDIETITTLQRKKIKKVLREQMIYYTKLKHVIWFVRELIDDGILASHEDPEKFRAWEIVQEWKESPIQDPVTRLATLIGNSPLVNVTCPVAKPHLISAYEIATDDCWRPVLEELLIVESAIRQDGLSMEIVFYGHPILMNYMYIVDKGLTSIIPRRIQKYSVPNERG